MLTTTRCQRQAVAQHRPMSKSSIQNWRSTRIFSTKCFSARFQRWLINRTCKCTYKVKATIQCCKTCVCFFTLQLKTWLLKMCFIVNKSQSNVAEVYRRQTTIAVKQTNASELAKLTDATASNSSFQSVNHFADSCTFSSPATAAVISKAKQNSFIVTVIVYFTTQIMKEVCHRSSSIILLFSWFLVDTQYDGGILPRAALGFSFHHFNDKWETLAHKRRYFSQWVQLKLRFICVHFLVEYSQVKFWLSGGRVTVIH